MYIFLFEDIYVPNIDILWDNFCQILVVISSPKLRYELEEPREKKKSLPQFMAKKTKTITQF